MNISQTERPVRAVVAIVIEDDRWLTIERSSHVRAPGAFCFPGGGIEPGESIEQALVREMRKELSVEVQPVRWIWNSTSATGVELFWWLVELAYDQTIQPNLAEVESFHWLTIKEIRDLPKLLASNVAFLDSLENGEFQP